MPDKQPEKRGDKQQVLIIHGGRTFPNEEEYQEFLRTCPIDLDRLRPRPDWKDGLQEKLGEEFDVLTPRMPNGTNAQYGDWRLWFERITEFLDEQVILVGHSLGGIFLAKYLSENTYPKAITGLMLIASPFDERGADESLGSYVIKNGLGNISRQAKQLFIYHSRDDEVVPFSHAEAYQEALSGATLRRFDDRGHFKQSDFPELVEDIRSVAGIAG